MPVILDFAELDTQRARDGVNFAPLPVLSIANGAFVNGLAASSCFPATMGPGATADVPGTHVFWSTSGGVIKRCNGETPTNIAGGPTRSQNYQLLYDAPNDRMYVAYFGPAGQNFRVAWFDFAETWDTSITNTLALATGSGCIRLIPAGAVNAGLLLAGWCNDSRVPGTRCVVQRWDGAAWQDELFTSNASNQPKTMIAHGATVVLGTIVSINNAAHPLVYERDAAGAWTDITPASWNIAFSRQCSALAVYEGTLYAAFRRATAATRVEIWKRDNLGAWSMDLDLIAEGTGLLGGPVSLTVIDGQLYCGLQDNQIGYFLLKPTPTGAWVHRAVGESQQFPGFPGDGSFFVEAAEGTIDPPSGNASGEHAPIVRIAGFWDAQEYIAWDPLATWLTNAGLWTLPSNVALATVVWMGADLLLETIPSGNAHVVGEIDVVDAFVLRGSPPNGKGLANVSVYLGYADPSIPVAEQFPLSLSDAYEYLCPAITSVDPVSADLNGGVLVTLHGTNFFSNQITPSNPANYARVVNRIFVRTGAGTVANPYRTEEVPYRMITFVDTETLTFTLPPFPGGSDPDAEIIFSPAGLAPFNFGAPVGIAPSYKCDRLTADFDYTGVDFAILGSLETLLGLGGTGGDVLLPGGGGGGAAAADVLCPTGVTAGPCDRS